MPPRQTSRRRSRKQSRAGRAGVACPAVFARARRARARGKHGVSPHTPLLYSQAVRSRRCSRSRLWGAEGQGPNLNMGQSPIPFTGKGKVRKGGLVRRIYSVRACDNWQSGSRHRVRFWQILHSHHSGVEGQGPGLNMGQSPIPHHWAWESVKRRPYPARTLCASMCWLAK